MVFQFSSLVKLTFLHVHEQANNVVAFVFCLMLTIKVLCQDSLVEIVRMKKGKKNTKNDIQTF